MRWDRKFLDGLIDTLMETMNDDSECSFLESGKLRAVTRMLLMPSRSITTIFQKKLATGPGDTPFEALVVSHRDRLLSNIRLLRSTYTFIPRTRAPPVCFHLIIFFTAYFYFCGQADWPPNGRNNACHYLRDQFEKYSLKNLYYVSRLMPIAQTETSLTKWVKNNSTPGWRGCFLALREHLTTMDPENLRILII